MSEGGDIEVASTTMTDVLPKDVVKEVGNIKLFNKWDYDVEVRDISLTYVSLPISRRVRKIFLGTNGLDDAATIFLSATPSTSPIPPAGTPLSGSARPTAPLSSD